MNGLMLKSKILIKLIRILKVLFLQVSNKKKANFGAFLIKEYSQIKKRIPKIKLVLNKFIQSKIK
jgi:hypothetical protein